MNKKYKNAIDGKFAFSEYALLVKWVCLAFILSSCIQRAYSVGPDKIGRNILVIHSYHQGLEWADSISSGILSVFKDKPEYNLYFEYLDTKRNNSPNYFNSVIELYRSRSSKISYDAIITCDNAAYDFMKEYRDEFFSDVPVFYCGVNFLDKKGLQTLDKFYGFEEIADHSGTIDMILQLFPKRKKVLIVNDYTLTGVSIRKELEKVLPDYERRLDFEVVDTFSIDELEQRVASLTDEYTIYLLVVNMDRMGNYISYNHGIHIIRDNTSVPIFGSWDFYLGKGIIGGAITRGFDQGENIAKLTYDYLSGINRNPQPYQTGEITRCLDYNLLVQFGIKDASLFNGIKVINKPIVPAWKILWLKIAIIVLLTLFVGSLFYIWNRKIQSRKLKELVDIRTKELKSANRNLKKINQSKNEILSIVAHDLKNPIGNVNGFSQLILDEDDANKMLDPESRVNLEHILDLSNYMIRLVNNLLDISVIESGVLKLDRFATDYIAFIRDEVVKNSALADSHGIELELNCKEEKAIVFFDMIKMQQAFNNLISNAIKFSKPNDKIHVTVECKEKMVITKIKDSGPGIPKEKFDLIFKRYPQVSSDLGIKAKGTGLGLSIVKGIIEAHQGKIYLTSVVGEGTEFIYELPMIKSKFTHPKV